MAFSKKLTSTIHRAVVAYLPESKAREPITDGHLHQGLGSIFFFQLEKFPDLRAVPKCFLEVEFIDRSDVERALIVPRKETFPIIAKALSNWLIQEFGGP